MNTTVFDYTDKQIRKKFSKETLDKYYDILCFLYQNGYSVNCNDDEVSEQLEMYNFFKSKEDLEELKKVSGKSSSLDVGKKIVSEELYDIVKNSTFCQIDCADNPTKLKSTANINWEKLKLNTSRIDSLFSCEDSEIKNVLVKYSKYEDIKNKISFLQSKINNDIRVLSFLKFKELVNVVYSVYIKITKVKTDEHKLTLCSNINSQIYGSIGGYNPITKEIKYIIGSAVWDLKNINETKNIPKLKQHADLILENKSDEKNEYIDYLERWKKGLEKDDDKARQIIINCLCNGIMTLLSFKHNLNFLEDNRNSIRAELIIDELKSILKCCNIDKSYLL